MGEATDLTASGVAALVAEWVAGTPDAPAITVAGSDESVSYGQLWARSGRLARELVDRGVEPGAVVATGMNRSVELVVGLLGVVRAGAAYLALDAKAPPDRTAEVLGDANVHFGLTGAGHDATGLPLTPVPVPTAGGVEPVDVPVDADDPCHVVYTSGSTGRPKGVVIPHRAVISLVDKPAFCTLRPGDRMAIAANPAFDAFTFELWGTLAAGATIVVLPDIADVGLDRWVELVRDELDALLLTTSVFHLVARERPAAFGSLDTLLFGGEQADSALIRRVLTEAPPGRMVNVYGPTETTTLATTLDCTLDSVPEHERVPIGYAIQDTTLSIMDDSGQPAANGEVGELYIGGAGVALGYLGRPDLTAERFVPDPSGSSCTVYRTGDLVRTRPDGALEVVGRRDRQVKVRGYRIELDEIEIAAKATGLVSAAIVEAVGTGNATGLIGFVLPQTADTAELADQLARRLPAYMLPSRWIPLADLPLQSVGKVDRARLVALATPDLAPAEPAEPADEVSRLVGDVWRELLGVPVHGGDNFLDLGGNSLLAVQIAARLRDQLAVPVEAAEVLLSDTFADLVDQLQRART
jgi:amino acid adenylation domain-containing protein